MTSFTAATVARPDHTSVTLIFSAICFITTTHTHTQSHRHTNTNTHTQIRHMHRSLANYITRTSCPEHHNCLFSLEECKPYTTKTLLSSFRFVCSCGNIKPDQIRLHIIIKESSQLILSPVTKTTIKVARTTICHAFLKSLTLWFSLIA